MSQTSNPPTEELLTVYFQQMLVRWGQEQPPRTGLHVAAVLVPENVWCLRKHVLLTQHPKLQSANGFWHTNAVFLNGWVLHEKWQRLFQRFARVVEVETAHYDEARQIFFTPDAVIAFGPHQYVVEIKGYHADRFTSLQAPPDAAVEQANLYMHLLGLSRAIVLVENKNTQEFKLWVIEADRERAEPYLKRIEAVKRANALAQSSGRLPSRLCQSSDDLVARRCPVRTLCFGNAHLE